MKKILRIFYILIFIIVLSSCNNPTNNSNNAKEQSFLEKYETAMTELSKAKVYTTDIIINTKIKVGDNTQNTMSRMRIDIGENPLYIMTATSENKTVIIEEKGYIYQYNEKNGVLQKQLLCSKDEFSKEDYQSSLTNTANLGINLDLVKKEDDIYVLNGKYGEVFDLNSEFVELYTSLGIDVDSVKNQQVRIEFYFYSSNTSIKMYTTSVINNLTADINVNMSMYATPASEIEWYGNVPSYEFMDYEKINIGDKLKFEDNLYKIYLPKGQYALISESISAYRYSKYDIFDINGEKMNFTFPIKSSYLDRTKGTFIIPEDGTYYIKTNKPNGEKSKMELVKLDYDSDYTQDNIITEGTYTGTIDGGFEFIKYVIYSDFDGSIKFLNNSTPFSIFYLWSNDYGSAVVERLYYIDLHKGENVFYICSSDYLSTKKENYNFSITFIKE